jgi:hypothetical protein
MQQEQPELHARLTANLTPEQQSVLQSAMLKGEEMQQTLRAISQQQHAAQMGEIDPIQMA